MQRQSYGSSYQQEVSIVSRYTQAMHPDSSPTIIITSSRSILDEVIERLRLVGTFPTNLLITSNISHAARVALTLAASANAVIVIFASAEVRERAKRNRIFCKIDNIANIDKIG